MVYWEEQNRICAEGVRVRPNPIVLQVGAWYSGVCAQICPANATNKRVTWSSSNADVATVNPTSGYIYGNQAGTATTATTTDGNFQACCTICVFSQNCINETIFTKLDELHQMAKNYAPSNAMQLTLQFLRKGTYNDANWDTVAGTVDQNFVSYVQSNNRELYDFFDREDCILYDREKGPVDFLHLCATMNGIIVGGGTYWKSLVVGRWHVANLAGWAGDLQTLVIDTIHHTGNSNPYTTFYEKFYQLMGDDRYSFGLADLLIPVKWPIYDNHHVSVLSNQQTAARDVFTDYLWAL